MNTSLFLLATEKSGGLFDLDGTLPLMGLQFLGLMFLLNLILYTPLLSIIYDRNQYINKNLASSANILAQSNKLIQNYENELLVTRKKGIQEISDFKKAHEEILRLEAKSAQNYLSQYNLKSSQRLNQKMEDVLKNLETNLASFRHQILNHVFSYH